METSEIRGFELIESSWSRSSNRFRVVRYCTLVAQDLQGVQCLLLQHLLPDEARYLAFELGEFLNVPVRDHASGSSEKTVSALESFRALLSGGAGRQSDSSR